MASNVSTVYINVIDDVINKVRGDFVASGAGEAVLNELQAIWEMKMMEWGVISGSIERLPPIQRHLGPITPVHDLNVPYEGTIEEYETPTAEMLFPPTPMQTPLSLQQTPMTDYNIPTGPSVFTNDIDLKAGRPSSYMQPPSPWMTQKPLGGVGVNVNVAYEEGRDVVDRGALCQPLTQDFFMMASGKRKRDDYPSQLTSGAYFPQQDGNGDITIEFVMPETNGAQSSSGKFRAGNSNKEAISVPVLPQKDGIQDEYDNLFPYGGVATEDYNAVNTPAGHVELHVATPSVGTPKPTKSEAVDDDEPPLNEDDDDDDDLDEVERGEEEPQTQHLVLAQFDKVTRTKSRWKCTLKDGIMRLNNKDILFNKATGEFDF